LVSDIPSGDGKMANLFYSVILYGVCQVRAVRQHLVGEPRASPQGRAATRGRHSLGQLLASQVGLLAR
jgi:hypothetical protein